MSNARAIVSFPSGRRGKWVVLALWIVILAVAGPLAGKLTGAEKNDAQSWLPAAGGVHKGPGPAVAVRVAQRVLRPWWCTTGRPA